MDEESPGAKHTPTLSRDWTAILHGFEHLLPTIYSLEATLDEANKQLAYLREMIEEFPPTSPAEESQFQERLAGLVDQIVGAYTNSRPSTMDFWLKMIDLMTHGLVRQMDESKMTPRTKEALRVAFEGYFSHQSLLIRTSPPPTPAIPPAPSLPTAEAVRREQRAAIELADFQLVPIVLDYGDAAAAAADA